VIIIMTNSHRHGFGGIGDGDGTVKRIATKNKEREVGGRRGEGGAGR